MTVIPSSTSGGAKANPFGDAIKKRALAHRPSAMPHSSRADGYQKTRFGNAGPDKTPPPKLPFQLAFLGSLFMLVGIQTMPGRPAVSMPSPSPATPSPTPTTSLASTPTYRRGQYEMDAAKILKLVNDNKVAEVRRRENGVLVFRLKDNTSVSYDPNVEPDPATTQKLFRTLSAKHLNPIEAVNDGMVWGIALQLLPFVLLLYLLQSMRRGGVGTGGVGRGVGKVHLETSPTTKLSDVGGHKAVKEELAYFAQILRGERKSLLGTKAPKGFLFHGPPGTGKTMLARAMAGELKMPFLVVSGSEFTEMYVGVGAARVRKLFAEAQRQIMEQESDNAKNGTQRKTGCVIFIDEVETIAKKRGMEHSQSEQEGTLNQLLAELDGFEERMGNIILMAATNRPDMLDPAFLRRIDHQIEVPLPSRSERQEILEKQLRKIRRTHQVTIAPDVQLATLAERTEGFSGSDLAQLLDRAIRFADRQNKLRVDNNDFDEAFITHRMGLPKVVDDTPGDLEQIATHEMGHVLAARALGKEIFAVLMEPRQNSLASVWIDPTGSNSPLRRKREALTDIFLGLGGLAGEQAVYGPNDVSSGAIGDLKMVRQNLLMMLANGQFGLDNAIDDFSEMHYQQALQNLKPEQRQVLIRVMENGLDKAVKMMEMMPEDAIRHMVDEALRQKRIIGRENVQAFFNDLEKSDKMAGVPWDEMKRLANEFVNNPEGTGQKPEKASDVLLGQPAWLAPSIKDEAKPVFREIPIE